MEIKIDKSDLDKNTIEEIAAERGIRAISFVQINEDGAVIKGE